MKVKTSELIDAALNLAVALALGWTVRADEKYGVMVVGPRNGDSSPWCSPNELPNWQGDWAQGGPLIERERIELEDTTMRGGANDWVATLRTAPLVVSEAYGPTALVAAMRCFVTSKLGEEVEVPEELL